MRTTPLPSPSRTTILVFLLASAAFVADFASKSWAERLHQPIEAGHFALAHIGNDALAFSLGSGELPVQGILLARFVLVALCVLVAARSATLSGRERLGFAMIASGGLGNLVDLPLRDGAVVDFIGVNPVALVSGHPGFHVFFNLADVSIFIGVALAFPVARAIGLRVQRRFLEWEDLALGRARPPVAS